MRFIHLLVICALVIGVSYVYRIKMESTARTERVQRLHADVRKQREAIAALHAECARLDSPRRLQGLAERHLKLKPLDARQYDQLKNLPERSPTLINPNAPDPIGAMIDTTDQEILTGSIPKPEGRQ